MGVVAEAALLSNHGSTRFVRECEEKRGSSFLGDRFFSNKRQQRHGSEFGLAHSHTALTPTEQDDFDVAEGVVAAAAAVLPPPAEVEEIFLEEVHLSSLAAADTEEDTVFSNISLDSLRRKLRSFAKDRDWGKFHSAKNLTMALVSEVGELSELFQWRSESDDPQDWSDEDRENLGRELSDVLCCIIRIAGKEAPIIICTALVG